MKRFYLKISIFFLVVLLLCILVYRKIENKDRNSFMDYNGKIKSANLSVDYDIDQVLTDVNKLGLNTVNVPIIVNIENTTSSDMKVDDKSKNKAIKLIKILKKDNIKVILEAYPWIKNGEQYETEWNPYDKNRFFNNWKNDVLEKVIDDVANPLNVDIINVASNFVYMEEYEENWCDIIDFVRYNYNGLITYRTSWWYTSENISECNTNFADKLNNNLFNKVDFISVAAYFELSNRPLNSSNEVVRSITNTTAHNRNQNIKEELHELSKKHNKPIFFGELGFPTKKGASIEPWNPLISNTKDDLEQSYCFEGYRVVFEKEEWLKGFSVFCVGKIDKEKNYYPSSKSVEIIKNWYNIK